MAVRYIVELAEAERHALKEMISKNKANRNTIVNAYILLKSDVTCAWTYEEIAASYEVSTKKVERVKKRFIEEGLEAALFRKPVTNIHCRKITGAEEAHVIALCCSPPPEGHTTWTLRMLADTMVAWEIVDSVSHETVRRTLKKTNVNPGRKKNGASLLSKMPPLSAKWKRS
jgi:transposase